MRTKKRKILWMMFFAFAFCAAFQSHCVKAEAKVVKRDVTPREPSSSDLQVVRKVTKLASKRWVQSFTMDSKYYYYIQMTKPYSGNLRITRVKYRGLGRYTRDHMDLKRFGHATNLDCSTVNGRTWLWTGSDCKKGSDVSRAISGFPYRKNTTLRKHGAIRYKIPDIRIGKYMTNVYPAINEDNTQMAVRYTYNNRQYFQIYNLIDGKFINPRGPVKRFSLDATYGDFQGFDLYGSSVYTIDGSPRRSFLKAYNREYNCSAVYHPTRIRRYDFDSGSSRRVVIRGAKRLSYREPEGIKVVYGRSIYIMYISNTLTNQSCNIYKVKRWI
ncbi:Hypothetical protein EHLA_2998 [Anaerobutyricum hallii]|uniref:P68 RBP/TagC-like beta-propeller domain-containing protein n=1 Tax=Anaerobutyricum hallii TaxID=39488 RepID=A0A285PVB8_9FIRM|nr:hypothetical protein [Anaerobutyricum hallii]SOB73549.1 Hypothetical protein EHLA_2998 [Anaerobutyricum hallii]